MCIVFTCRLEGQTNPYAIALRDKAGDIDATRCVSGEYATIKEVLPPLPLPRNGCTDPMDPNPYLTTTFKPGKHSGEAAQHCTPCDNPIDQAGNGVYSYIDAESILKEMPQHREDPLTESSTGNSHYEPLQLVPADTEVYYSTPAAAFPTAGDANTSSAAAAVTAPVQCGNSQYTELILQMKDEKPDYATLNI